MESNREIAIKISNVKKMYKLGQIGGGTLQADIQSWWARKRGKEDPNTKIGQEQRLVGQTFMALNGIDLTIYKGEAVGIIGSNGAGKSTMLKLLSRVTAPTSGEIDIYGRITSMLEVGTGFNGEMTGRENVYLNGAILGMTKAEIDAKMEQIIEFSEVRDFIDTPVKRYSSGMYVKLAFSVAAHLDSEIMIMDEVLAVGDMAFQKKCLDKMRDAAKKEGRTVLYVSHNMNTIRQLCDRCIVLDKGKVIFDGDVERAISIYLGSNADRFATEYDLSHSRMDHMSKKVEAKLINVSLLEKTTPVYDIDEDIKICVSILPYKDVEKPSLRFEVRTDNEYVIGAGYCSISGLKNGKVSNFNFSFKNKGLVPTRYRVCLVLYEKDAYGNCIDLDGVWTAMNFEVVDSQGKIDVVWDKKEWGFVSFDLLNT